MFTYFRVFIINDHNRNIISYSLKHIRFVSFHYNRNTNKTRKMMKRNYNTTISSSKDNFIKAVEALNLLQTNASVIRKSIVEPEYAGRFNIKETEKYLLKSGISLLELDNLPVIHVSGTKGKGSTCSIVESILQSVGLKTGFFSSPHLVCVTERIKINGHAISQENFGKYFWKIYNILNKKKDNCNDMPAYFKFLTVMAFHVFKAEKVDVAIIEVGIGGEYDCTNVLRNTQTAGITSLGLEHTNVLGKTIEEIAWQKAGIIKLGTNVFTVNNQPENCLQIIQNRADKKKAKLHVAPNFEEYEANNRLIHFGLHNKVQKLNASLAIQICYSFLKSNKSVLSDKILEKITFLNEDDELCLTLSEEVVKGLENWFWPGRCHLIEYQSKRIYLDGAHTMESMEICMDWFENNVKNSKRPRCLIFNTTGDRDYEKMLKIIYDRVSFDFVYFVPNIAHCKSISKDHSNYVVQSDDPIKRCKGHENSWINLGTTKSPNGKTFTLSCVTEALNHINKTSGDQSDILVTGSLHLIGATILTLENIKDEREVNRMKMV